MRAQSEFICAEEVAARWRWPSRSLIYALAPVTGEPTEPI